MPVYLTSLILLSRQSHFDLTRLRSFLELVPSLPKFQSDWFLPSVLDGMGMVSDEMEVRTRIEGSKVPEGEKMTTQLALICLEVSVFQLSFRLL